MGVLGNQLPRQDFRVSNEYLDKFLVDAVRLANKHLISVDSVIEARRVLEMERGNSILVEAGCK